MQRRSFAAVVTLTVGVFAAAFVGGCSSSSSSPFTLFGGDTAVDDAGPDVTLPPDTGARDSTVVDSTTSDVSNRDAPADVVPEVLPDALVVSCVDYCGAIQSACPPTGVRAQFTTVDSCIGTCAAYPASVVGSTSGNYLSCRAWHAALAASDPATHCKAAGPTGGDNDGADSAEGPCGDVCDSFCDIALVACGGQPSAYADKAACMSECRTFAAETVDYSTADATKNDVGCRVYHLTIAAGGAAAATTHCPHIRASSTVCTM